MRRVPLADLLAALFLIAICVAVFQQIATSFAKQGIAGGTPYDDAASYPRAVSITIMALLGISIAQKWRRTKRAGEGEGARAEPLDVAALVRPAALVGMFALYLVGLGLVGYSLATPPMVFAMMKLCGARATGRAGAVAVCATLLTAIVFEEGLNVVLPGGAINWNLHWLW